MTTELLPALGADSEPTRATLHAYARAVGVIPRAHGIAHPKWWHIGLKVRPEGLATDPVPLPGGGTLAVAMDLMRHGIVLRTSQGQDRRFDMRAGASGTEMGEELIAAAAGFGLGGSYDRARFADDDPRAYDPAAAEAYFTAFTNVSTWFERHRATLGARVGPVQVWPHGFDLAFEWFGTKTVRHEGEELPAQLNLGFFPGGEPYFYSNPWPLDDAVREAPLPHGARWTTDGFDGSILPYAALRDDPDAEVKLREYARAVFQAAAPTLEAH